MRGRGSVLARLSDPDTATATPSRGEAQAAAQPSLRVAAGAPAAPESAGPRKARGRGSVAAPPAVNDWEELSVDDAAAALSALGLGRDEDAEDSTPLPAKQGDRAGEESNERRADGSGIDGRQGGGGGVEKPAGGSKATPGKPRGRGASKFIREASDDDS